jgi:uncharacterized protein (TIGR03435 family)
MRWTLCGALLVVVCSASYVHTQVTPAFEVATIKPTVSASGVTGGCRGIDSKLSAADRRNNVPLGRCVITGGRFSHLMAIAFQLPMQRIAGFPDWDGPHRFDIQARAEDPSSATEGQLIAMLQAFMTQQFRLRLHRESKEAPIFALVVGKNGPRNLKPSEEAGAGMRPSGAGLVFKGYSMKELAEFLSNMPSVERPVRDMTGLQGRFDFTLQVLETKTESVEDLKVAMARWETIFSDVQEQLGLRFESTKGPLETLIIDHAEKPAVQD